ncbi:M23 family metallopeptidase [Magnetospirillum moscoviense]|uniref:Peptidase M23 n=1 Tax=Magnetospirillum moscoviense TaxID=1437059 RepID=A0A178MW78_9PROT|nr:M23 family metallopeptidase [Magnetospirillum moscoviense]OAN53230.1 peptidase M23 [Magnetospirillum moscoviense]
MKAVILAAALAVSLPAAAAELSGRLEQGGLVVGVTRPGTKVTLDGRPVPVDAAGHFLLGFGRDAAPQAILAEDGRTQTLSIARRDWPVQRIDGLPPAKVSPDPAQLARIKAENQLIADRRAIIGPQPDYLAGAVPPAEGIVSGVFGSQRILNGEPRSPHSGTDIAAGIGAPVRAIAAGQVSLVHPDMFFTGQTVMIDHGLGLQSVYAHLSRVDVTEDQKIGKGQPIGAVGASGRATGPHLHWGASWLDVRLDPETVQAVLGRNWSP